MRGDPSVHLAFGEAGAILAALDLINRSYGLVWCCVASCAQSRQSRALQCIEHCLGVEGTLNSQSLDLHYSLLPHNRQATERITRGKTVSLIRRILMLPAALGGASERDLQLIERITLFSGLS